MIVGKIDLAALPQRYTMRGVRRALIEEAVRSGLSQRKAADSILDRYYVDTDEYNRENRLDDLRKLIREHRRFNEYGPRDNPDPM